MSLFILGCNSSGTGGIDLSSYITKDGYKITYSKLWSSDTGRNSMTGENKGTFIGIFPKFSVRVGQIKTTRTMARQILAIVNSATFYCKWYDAEDGNMKTASFYAGDIAVNVTSSNTGRDRGLVIIEPFSIIANSKRE